MPPAVCDGEETMTQSETKAKRRLSLSTMTVISMILGMGWGLFLGEYGGWVKYIGDAFVGLLQMTVLPYVAVSLIGNVGRLQMHQGVRLARAALFVMLLLWAIAVAVLFIMSLAYPEWETGSFFSSSTVETSESLDWIELFIPSNPFKSLATNLVPGVVVFSIGLGIALMNVPNKGQFLDQLDILVEGLARLNKLVVKLSPIGIFAIMGHTSATLSVTQFGLLQGYLLAHALSAIILSFWVLPSLIACCTPFSRREVATASRDALLTAFVIGNTFVVLPMIVDATKAMFAKYGADELTPDSSPGYTVQLAYPFPDLGRIVGLIFIPFAAWFYGTSIEPTSIPALLGVGIIGSFAKPIVTIPMLLDLAELPGDIFNLFIAVGVVASRFGDLMKTMHLFAFGVLTSSILMGKFRFNWRRLLTTAIPTVVIFAAVVIGLRVFLNVSFHDSFSKEELVSARKLTSEPVESTLLKELTPNPEPLLEGEDPLARIRRRGTIRIGIRTDNLPFSYVNRDGELVGLDIDMAHELARALDVTIEFVPFTSDVVAALRDDCFDVAMSGLETTLKRATELPFTSPYMEVRVAIVTRDYDRKRFSKREDFADDTSVKIAVVKDSKASEALARHVECTIVEVDSERAFFESAEPVADMLLTSAEVGSAWTLIHPSYSVTILPESDIRLPLYYYVERQSQLKEFLNEWLELTKRNGKIEALYEYWILGVDSKDASPRWCIIRNVLGWVE